MYKTVSIIIGITFSVICQSVYASNQEYNLEKHMLAKEVFDKSGVPEELKQKIASTAIDVSKKKIYCPKAIALHTDGAGRNVYSGQSDGTLKIALESLGDSVKAHGPYKFVKLIKSPGAFICEYEGVPEVTPPDTTSISLVGHYEDLENHCRLIVPTDGNINISNTYFECE